MQRSLGGERRQLTALACGLADAATLAARLDPEDFHDLVRVMQQACLPVVARYGGHAAQSRGEALLVYFGYPLAHEDDARRAVRAGLELVEAVQQLDPARLGLRDFRPALRVGIHTGLVVVEADDGQAPAAMGRTPAVAAALETLAPPGGVVISGATERLVRGFFRCEPIDDIAAPDAGGPLFRVLAASGAEDRLEAAGENLTPLVGREQELALLLDRWQQAQEGLGQVALISGEAGIGKSRLLLALRERLLGGARRWECRCSPYF